MKPSWLQQVRELAGRTDAVVPTWLRPYLAGLRPAWWVARGYLLAAGLAVWTGVVTWGIPFIPSIRGNWIAGGILTVVAVLVSVRLGVRADPRHSRRVAVLAVDVVAVVAAVFVAEQMSTQPDYAYPDGGYGPTCTDVTNLQPYDASGRPLADIRLVDQNGYPFDLVGLGCGNIDGSLDYSRAGTFPYPTLPVDPAYQLPTGPPASLTPLPGATVSSSTTPSSSGSPTPSVTPSASGTR